MSERHFVDHDAQTVVIVMTSGPSTPQRCATPFYIGALLAAMDAQVTIFFTMEAVRLIRKGVPDALVAMEGGKRIIEFMRDAKSAGVRFQACSPALPGYEMEAGDLIDEIDEVSSGGALADMILSSDKVLFF
ncbi:MAG: DsrE family protein [Burkholderiales bacterium]|nr:DsrE family protein [Burkholderiales bacterium]